jgi:hypothetical protein
MTRAITVEIPDEVYQPLVVRAQEAGRSPEALAGDLIAQGIRHPGMSQEMRRWAGSLKSDAPDAAERHDDYLGRAQAESLRR